MKRGLAERVIIWMIMHLQVRAFLVTARKCRYGACLSLKIPQRTGIATGISRPYPESNINGTNEDLLLTLIPASQYSNDKDLPQAFAYPHWYEPHPIAIWTSNQLRSQINESPHLGDFGLLVNSTAIADDVAAVGKMFGVLVVRIPNGQLGFLKAYSGSLPGALPNDGFCPPIYNRFDRHSFYQRDEAELNDINRQVERLEANPERNRLLSQLESIQMACADQISQAKQQQKAERKKRQLQRQEQQSRLSPDEYQALDERLMQEGAAIQRQLKRLKAETKETIRQAQALVDDCEGRIKELKDRRKLKSCAVQNRLFDNYQFLNIQGQRKSLLPIFANTPLERPPGGAGDCAAPKLLQHAFSRGYQPIAMAEFWWGKSPLTEMRRHNLYYPACRGKCQPILEHMLEGMNVGANPLETVSESHATAKDLETLYEDEYFLVLNKPEEMLSVPGRILSDSVYTEIQKRYPNATGPLLVHRLDMSTSGILLVAKDKDIHKELSAQFIDRSVKKRYTALLEGRLLPSQGSKGTIVLPLTSDYINRPMQKVDVLNGKSAQTNWELLDVNNDRTRVCLSPVTGRTHQLRVHTAHAQGLNVPIVGDDIYGQRAERLCLHASYLEFTHPVTNGRMSFSSDAPF